MSELVINQSTWMDTGEPVKDSLTLRNPGGFVVNVEATDEEPLRLSSCACHNGRPSFDRVEGDPAGVRRDPNYADGAHSLDLGVVEDRSNLFGTSSGEDLNADTYGDAAEMQRRRGKFRADLGLRDEDENPEKARNKTRQTIDLGVQPVPGFPLRSRLAD